LRREELKGVREGLRKLQARFERRNDVKAEIVGLQLKMFVNEADGLGFFTGGFGRDIVMPGTFPYRSPVVRHDRFQRD
jgi:hypothetical protein